MYGHGQPSKHDQNVYVACMHAWSNSECAQSQHWDLGNEV